MNLHEYQGKAILKSFGVAIQEGKVVDNVGEAVSAAKDAKQAGKDAKKVKISESVAPVL